MTTRRRSYSHFCVRRRMPPISSLATMAGRALLAAIDAMRLCISFTSAPAGAASGEAAPVPDRMLHARIAGEHYGVFDVFFDTRSPEQVVVGQTPLRTATRPITTCG